MRQIFDDTVQDLRSGSAPTTLRSGVPWENVFNLYISSSDPAYSTGINMWFNSTQEKLKVRTDETHTYSFIPELMPSTTSSTSTSSSTTTSSLSSTSTSSTASTVSTSSSTESTSSTASTASTTSSSSSTASTLSSTSTSSSTMTTVTVGPASGVFYPEASADDWESKYFGAFNSSAEYVSLGKHAGDQCLSGVRFKNVIIPQGATIDSAFIRVIAYENESSSCLPRIYANDIDNAVNPTSKAEASFLVKTTAKIAWTLPAFTTGGSYDSPEIKTVIQEVVDRVGWASGNSLMVIINEDGYSSIGAGRRFRSFDYNGGIDKAELHVEWTP